VTRCGQVLGNSEIVASTDESGARSCSFFLPEHLLNNRLQMRDSGTTGKVVTLTNNNENWSVRTGQGELQTARQMLANAADRSELLASTRNAPNNGPTRSNARFGKFWQNGFL